MSADKYPCIFSREMETIVYITTKYILLLAMENNLGLTQSYELRKSI